VATPVNVRQSPFLRGILHLRGVHATSRDTALNCGMMQDLSESWCFTERAKICFIVNHSLANLSHEIGPRTGDLLSQRDLKVTTGVNDIIPRANNRPN
jgi:hypothetical protein